MSATGALYSSMAVSSIGSLGTAFAQSSALKSAGNYQASIARSNASLAQMAGEQTIQSGDIQAGRKNLETQQVVGETKATQGASGINVGSGSSAIVRNAQNLVGATDEMTIRNNAARAAFGYKVQAIQEQGKATFAELTAKSEAEQTMLTGGLQAVSGPLQQYAQYKYLERRLGQGGGDTIPNDYTG